MDETTWSSMGEVNGQRLMLQKLARRNGTRSVSQNREGAEWQVTGMVDAVKEKNGCSNQRSRNWDE